MGIGSNAVPLVIQAFGSDKITYNGQQDLEQARTLGLAQTVIICIPWMICFGVYSLLLWSFPIDVNRVEKEQQEMAIVEKGQSLSHSRVGKRVRSVKFERYGLLLSQLRLSLYHLISCTEVAPTRCFFLPPLVELCYFHDVISCGFTRVAASCVVTPEKGSVSDVQQVHQHDGYFQNVITRCIVIHARRSHRCRV